METSPPAPEKIVPAAKRGKPLALRLGLVAGGILLAGIVLMLVTADTHTKEVVWLPPSDLKAGRMENLKYTLMRWTSPLWRGYWRRQPIVLIGSTMLATPATSAAQFGLGLPTATNLDGLQVWTLSAAELSKLRQRFKSLPDDMLLGSPSVSTIAGGWAEVSILNAGYGLTVTLRANAHGNSWTLTTGATLTEPATSASPNGLLLRTNFAAACRATIPNAGALVIQCGNRTQVQGTNYWLIVSPVAIDAQGHPLRR